MAFSQEKQNTAGDDRGLIKVAIMYPYAEGKTFDMDYYKAKHMPMVAKLLGSNLIKYTIEKGMTNGTSNQPMPYLVIGTFYVKSLSEYQAAMAANRESVHADIANYTNVIPVIFYSEVVK